MNKQMRGFSLIELMIVLAIVAILAAIAVPSYQTQVSDGRRADAVAVLTQSRQLMERYYSKNYSYANVPAGTLPTKSPLDGTTTYYAITVASTATTFTITATPQDTSDRCGVLTIDQAGAKTSVGDPIDICWR